MLAALLIPAILLAGIAGGPWWFWLLGGAALAALSITDPRRAPSVAGTGVSALLLPAPLLSLSMGCLLSAATFAAGRILAWALLPA